VAVGCWASLACAPWQAALCWLLHRDPASQQGLCRLATSGQGPKAATQSEEATARYPFSAAAPYPGVNLELQDWQDSRNGAHCRNDSKPSEGRRPEMSSRVATWRWRHGTGAFACMRPLLLPPVPASCQSDAHRRPLQQDWKQSTDVWGGHRQRGCAKRRGAKSSSESSEKSHTLGVANYLMWWEHGRAAAPAAAALHRQPLSCGNRGPANGAPWRQPSSQG
jgi:hypothetical protein